MSNLPKIGDKKSLTQKAYDAIKEAILLNQLKPGELLKEEKLAESLVISRTPIRSALKQLSYEHLVTINSSRNMIVSTITQKDIEELYVVREALELATVRELKGRITNENIRVLEGILSRQEQARLEEDYVEYVKLELEFHVSLAKYTRNKWIIEMSSTVHTIVQRYLVLSGSLKKHSSAASEEHRRILAAIAEGDFEKAEQLMFEHIDKVKNRILT
ncbi:MAG: GntR family transcriptional regulator [Thermotaleaceae bacterium]